MGELTMDNVMNRPYYEEFAQSGFTDYVEFLEDKVKDLKSDRFDQGQTIRRLERTIENLNEDVDNLQEELDAEVTNRESYKAYVGEIVKDAKELWDSM